MSKLLLWFALVANTAPNPDEVIQKRYVEDSTGTYNYFTDTVSIFTKSIHYKESDGEYEYAFIYFSPECKYSSLHRRILEEHDSLEWWRKQNPLYKVYFYVNQQGFLFIKPVYWK